jgi:hypothetical protein
MIDNLTNWATAGARRQYQGICRRKTRLADAPEIPTVDEAGLPGFYLSQWHGLWVAPSWTLWQIQPCVSASPTSARKFLCATSGRRKRSALSKN